MDLTTTYMGLPLSSPLVAGASPLTDSADHARKLEDAGASAIVMRSLFLEQIEREYEAAMQMDAHEGLSAEATGFVTEPLDFALGPNEHLEQLAAMKKAVGIPVFGSLNGVRPGGWADTARQMEQTGIDGLELNIYSLPLDGSESPAAADQRTLDILAEVQAAVDIPVAVKLTYFMSSPIYLGRQLAEAGAAGLVLFNRLYLPDINPDDLDVTAAIHLSSPEHLRLRLLWLAAMFGKVDADLAATGGVHSGKDVVKAVMAGASVTQMASALLRHGVGHVGIVKAELAAWLEEHDYSSLAQMKGSMSLARTPDPGAYERANYLKVLHTW